MIRKTATRSALLLLPLLLLPLPAQARQVASADRTHTVQPGETLSGIAQQYLGSAAQWARLLEANRERLSDPNRIQVGMTLVIPGGGAPGGVADAPAPGAVPGGPPATVFGVEVAGQQLTVQDPSVQGPYSYQVRRELLRYRPFEPIGIPDVAIEDRTVFYELRSPDDALTQVILQPPEEIPALPAAVFHSAGWLITGDDGDRFGEVIGFAEDQDIRFNRTTVHPYDEVRVRFFVEGSPQVGDELLVYGTMRSVQGVGDVAVPTGRLRVTRVEGPGVIGQVVAQYDRLEVGQSVTRMRTFPLEPGVHPFDSQVRTEASILAFQDRKEIYLPGDIAFVDRGRQHGLRVGDELLARVAGAEDLPDAWEARSVARFQVIGVREDQATVRIVSIHSPGALRPGLGLVLDRRMP